MRAHNRCIGLLLGAALAMPGLAPAGTASAAEEAATVREVAPGDYVRPGHDAVLFQGNRVANIGFIVGGRCVAVIDTGGSRAEGAALLKAIRQVTAKPVCYVINTHVHPDHILGNPAFKDTDAVFIGHKNLPRAVALVGDTYLKRAPNARIVPPDQTVADTRQVDLGGRRLRLTAEPQAHTDNDLIVYDLKTRTLWTGDLLFVRHIPVIDGSLTGWLELVPGLKEIPAQRAVPGHGPPSVGWPEATDDMLRYLTTLRNETRAFIDRGGTISAAQNKVGYGERGRWDLFDEYHKRNVISAYTELEWQ